MSKTRLEAFSDGVLAIIITIMVLEIKVPHEASFHALEELVSVFTSYLFSFIFIAVYWLNHHHLMHCVKKVTTKLIWANMGLLFTLSLIPFTTGWIGEHNYASIPLFVYCVNQLLCGIAAFFLQLAITSDLPADDKIFSIIKFNMKRNIVSVVCFTIAIACSFYYPMLSVTLVFITMVTWIIPDRRIEKILETE